MQRLQGVKTPKTSSRESVSTVSFIILCPLAALFFWVQKVSLLDTHLLMPWSRQLKRKHKNGVSLRERAAVVSDLSSDGTWPSPRRRRRPPPFPISSSTPQRARKTSGSIIVTSSTPELILFHRRLLGMIINAPGYQQALPPIIKKTRITPGALLRKEEEMFSVIYCTVPVPVAAPHQIIPPPACASVRILQGGWCRNAASIISRAGGVSRYVLGGFFCPYQNAHVPFS